LETAASKLAKYKLYLMAFQDVRWHEAGSQPADGYTYFYGNENVNCHLGTFLYIRKSGHELRGKIY